MERIKPIPNIRIGTLQTERFGEVYYYLRRDEDLRLEVVQFLVSETGEQHGFGTNRYKWVSRMTKRERDFLREKSDRKRKIFIRSSRKSGGKHGTYWRQVIWDKFKFSNFYPRTVTKEEETILTEGFQYEG